MPRSYRLYSQRLGYVSRNFACYPPRVNTPQDNDTVIYHGLDDMIMPSPSPTVDLAEIHILQLLGTPRPAHQEGWTAELENEDDPTGAVVIKDAKGRPRLWMPREVYDDVRTYGQAHPETDTASA